MNFLNMTKFHLRRIGTSPSLLAMMAFPVIAVLFFGYMFSSEADSGGSSLNRTVILLGQGNGDLKKSLHVYDYKDNIWTDRDIAYKELEEGKVGIIYEIPDRYIDRLAKGEQVNVKLANREKNTRSAFFEYDLNYMTRELLLNKTVSNQLPEVLSITYQKNIKIQSVKKKENVTSLIIAMFMMVIFYLVMTCLNVAIDLVTFKKNNTLRRAILSPNSNRVIMGSHLAAFVIVIAITNFVILGYLHTMSPLTGELLLRMSLILVLAILFGLSLCLVMFRTFKEPAAVSNIGVLILMLLLGITFLTDFDLNPMLTNLAYLSPFKWFLSILETGLSPSAIIMPLLMSAVLFTAGSYKLENYVQR